MPQRYLIAICIFISAIISNAQTSELTIEKIMQDPKWIGTSPQNPEWGQDGNLYFNWNPENMEEDSTYFVNSKSLIPQKLNQHLRKDLIDQESIIFSKNRYTACYTHKGDIYYVDGKVKLPLRITNTSSFEFAIGFVDDDRKIAYYSGENIFLWDIKNGQITQITDVKEGKKPKDKELKKPAGREAILESQQLELFDNLRDKAKKDAAQKKLKKETTDHLPYKFYMGDSRMNQVSISPDLQTISFITSEKSEEGLQTIVPNYVTTSGYTEEINAREKVGEKLTNSFVSIYDVSNDSLYDFDLSSLPGIKNVPEFYNDYPSVKDSLVKANRNKSVNINSMTWSPNGKFGVLNITSNDNKDRWICLIDTETKKISCIDHQHDEAWIGGPLVNRGLVFWLNDEDICFASESTGYTHLYKYNIAGKVIKPLTSGKFEIQYCKLSLDKKSVYLLSNQKHPGTQVLVRLDLKSLNQEILIDLNSGLKDVSFSPDEQWISFLSSTSNIPWELYLKENKKEGKLTRITNLSVSKEFAKYPWREPEVVTFKARDGVEVYARLYKPKTQDINRPAVIFVHGAGYLQNAHQWWSSYFREYMFHNMLTDLGYTVLDIDYRASSGYGRDVRTGIYRHMGGKDLEDQIDGAKFLVDNCNVSKDNIGIYGGSYGGFITLMALFNEPEVFKAGAALRPVTDWQHYNHGYTSNILNTPLEDSIAYAKSSPINFAKGLKNHLLICHGMVDSNVHFQDVVRLQQRLIELGKDNWEVAAYPMEGHGFTYPSSWIDEYKRIFKLFEETLRR